MSTTKSEMLLRVEGFFQFGKYLMEAVVHSGSLHRDTSRNQDRIRSPETRFRMGLKVGIPNPNPKPFLDPIKTYILKDLYKEIIIRNLQKGSPSGSR